MDKEIILTEDPNKELWNLFKQFENTETCLNYFKKNCSKFDNSEKFNKRASLMKYYITQAKEYYDSSIERLKKRNMLVDPFDC